jgi:uncharacterized repeat protein (TIGR02543 family)
MFGFTTSLLQVSERTVKTVLVQILAILLIISLLSFPQPALSANGDPIGPSTFNDSDCNLDDGMVGNHTTADSAFLISSADQLWEVTDCTSSTPVFFELTNDIDVSDAEHAPTNLPIGFVAVSPVLNVKAFRGVLDGKGHKITGIAMSTTGHGAGLFAHLEDATVQNLEIYGSITSIGVGNGIEPETFESTGGLAQLGSGNITIQSVANFASISGAYRVGGLIGFVEESTLSILQSFNSANVTASAGYVGGLVGLNRVMSPNSRTSNVTDSFNTGLISAGVGNAGGLVGITAGTGSLAMNLNSSYNTGTVISGNANKDGLLMKGSGTTLTTTSFTSQSSLHASTTALADFKQALNLAGFDFTNTWGFGLFTENAGLPILRSNSSATSFLPDGPGYLVSFDSSGGSSVSSSIFNSTNPIQIPANPNLSGSTFAGWSLATSGQPVTFPYAPGTSAAVTLYAQWTLNPSPTPIESSAPAPVYSGPVIDSALNVQAGTEATFTGKRLASVTAAFVGDIQLLVVAAESQSLVLEVPRSLSPGIYDLVIRSSFGTLTFQQGLTVLASSTEEAETETSAESESEQFDQKLTAVALQGFVAIYTKGYEGQKLSAKVAGKWLVVSELDESWNGNDYSRTLRAAGSGYDISVHLYIDGKFISIREITTK